MVEHTVEVEILATYDRLRSETGDIPSTGAISRVIAAEVTRRQISHALRKHKRKLGPPSRRRKITHERADELLAEYLADDVSVGELAKREGVHDKTMRAVLERANGGAFPNRCMPAIAEARIPREPKVRPCLRCLEEVVDVFVCKRCRRQNEIDSRGALA